MKRIVPNKIFRGAPCSVVALGCALHVTNRGALRALYSDDMKADGYLSLRGMNALVRAHMHVKQRWNFKKDVRPCLRDFCHDFSGRAIVCVLGHFVYVEDGDYYSYFFNGDDKVVTVWVL